MNHVTLIGRLTRDPEIKKTRGDMSVCNATLAVDRQVKADEEKKADFINITLFGKQADVFAKYLTKGRQIAIEGRIQTSTYEKENGEKVYRTDVVVNRFEFLGSQYDTRSNGPSKPSNPPQNGTPNFMMPEGFEAVDDDIPF